MIPWLPKELLFPPLASALTADDGANGLLAAGGDLSPQRILAAYRHGIFPWFSEGDPILWWSPDPRMVLVPGEIRITKSLARTLRNADYEVRLDTAFDRVIAACSTTPRHGQRGTWILPEMQQAYCRLHELGYAHSVETWVDGKLVGGLYGLAIGRAFFGAFTGLEVTGFSASPRSLAGASLLRAAFRRWSSTITRETWHPALASGFSRAGSLLQWFGRVHKCCVHNQAPCRSEPARGGR